jgi:hypothetical protein
MATQPSLRIGDREREATAAELREHYAHGRLTLEEFNQRLDAVFAARTQRDLTQITSDLPHVRTSSAPLPSARTRPGQQFTSASAGGWPGSGTVGASSAGPGAATPTAWQDSRQSYGPGGSGWSGGSGRRGGLGAFVTLLAAVASWLLVYDVLLVGWQLPWVGRAGLLVAIFTLIRGLLRRIFGGGRRRVPRPRRRRW